VGLRSSSDELSIEKPPDSTSTSYLAAKAEMENAASCSIRRKSPVRNLAPTSSRYNMPIGIRSWTADGKMAKHPRDEKKALSY